MRLQEKSRDLLSWIVANWHSTHVIFIILAVVFGVYFAFKVPVGYTHDESVHAFRAYQLQAGQLFSHPVQTTVVNGERITLHGGKVANSIIDLEHQTSAGSRHEALCEMNGRCYEPSAETQKKVQAASQQSVNPEYKTPIHTWGASYYFFLSYLPAAIGMQIAELFNTNAADMIYAARVGNVLAFAAIVGWAIYLLRKNMARYLVFAVGLFPLTVSLSAGLGVDMLLNASALLLFALMIRAYQDGDKFSGRLKIVLLVAAVLIPVLKLPYILLSLAVTFLPIFGKGRKAWLLRGAALLLILLPTIVWNLATADMVRAQAVMSSSPGDMVSTSGQIEHVKDHPFDFMFVILKSIFTQNWLNYMGGITQQGVAFPAIVYYFEIVPVIITAYVAALYFKTKSRNLYVALVVLGSAALALSAIFVSLYISYTPIGGNLVLGVQGRYLIPALPFLFFGVALCFKKYLKAIPTKWENPLYLYTTYALLLLVCAIWYHYMVYVWV